MLGSALDTFVKTSYQQYINSLGETNLNNINDILVVNETVLDCINHLFNELDKYSSTLPITNSVVSSIVKAIIELFARLITNFKSIAIAFYKSVKRSELQYFVQAHPLTVRHIESVNYLDIMDCKIPTPLFVNKPLVAINNDFYSFYKNLKIKDTSKQIYLLIDTVCKNILSDPEDTKEIKKQIDQLKQTTNNRYCQSIIKYLISHISLKQPSLTITFGKVFRNIKELTTIKSTLLSYETDLYNNCMFAHSMVNKCDKALESFEKKITDTIPDVIIGNKKLLKDFANQIHSAAFYFETVGTYAKEVNHLSHYIVEVYKAINEEIG